MEKRIYTAVDADEVEAGTYGYIADSVSCMKNMISRGEFVQCASIIDDTHIGRFKTIKGNIFSLFYPVVSKDNWSAYKHYQDGGVVCSDGKRYSKKDEGAELDWLNARYDIDAGTNQRLMTNKELARWLRNKPDRECKKCINCVVDIWSISGHHDYSEGAEDAPIDNDIYIRENDSPWFVPFVEE